MQKHKQPKQGSGLEEIVLLAREKLDDSGLLIERKQALAIAALVAVLLCVSVFLYRVSQPKPVVVQKAGAEEAGIRGERTPASRAVEGKSERLVVVHVAGAVVRPGVYRLNEGSRTADAIAEAGGGVEGADAHALNLAAKVFDGQRVYVPKKGEAPRVEQAVSLGGGAAMLDGGKVNLNAATPAQLDALPGVGEVTAGRIIEYRTKRGSFRRIDELKEVDGIGPKKYDQLKDHVCVE